LSCIRLSIRWLASVSSPHHMTDEPVTNPELGHQMPKSTRKRAANLNPRMESARPPRSKATRARTIEPAARKQAILDAALTVFSERGFEAARLDDIAVRAGVAKGTLYLYFNDKEGLFEEVLRSAVNPILERLSVLATAPDISVDKTLAALFSIFQNEILGTKRKLLIRLIIAEGPRFPRIAEFYYRNVVSRIMPRLANVAERAVEKGTFSSDAYARYPQLIAAPLLLAVIWDSLFASIRPLDVANFLRAHRQALMGKTLAAP
jgi:AcrR family transcriptional regulator